MSRGGSHRAFVCMAALVFAACSDSASSDGSGTADGSSDGNPDGGNASGEDTGVPDVADGSAATSGDGSGHGGGASPDASEPPLPACKFYVSPTGNDANSGTMASAPFATLQKAQTAMQGLTSGRVTCLRAGIYDMSKAALVLTQADDDETWQYYSPDGIDTAILDGGMTSAGQTPAGNTGSGLLQISSGSNITVNGLGCRNHADWCLMIQANAGADANGNTLINNEVYNGYPDAGSAAGGIGFNITYEGDGVGKDRVKNTRIANNYVHDVGRNAIASYGTPMVDSWSGCVIENNVLLRTVQSTADEGAIYIWSSNQLPTPNSCTIRNNFIRDYGSSGEYQGTLQYGILAHGIYLDNGYNGATVTGNVIGPPTAGALSATNSNDTANVIFNTDDLSDDKGGDNALVNNIIDLGASSYDAAFLGGGVYTPTTTIADNVVLSNYAGAQQANSSGTSGDTYFPYASASDVSIANNTYVNYGGGSANTSANLGPGDTSPQRPTAAQLQCSGYLYGLGAGSVVYGPPMNFKPIAGGWGPAGFPSSKLASTNHSCP
jgi:hypothetical protein